MKRVPFACIAIACGIWGVSDQALADSAFASQSRWMTGDWGGLRTDLLQQGVDIKLGYIGETATLLRGGYSGAGHPTRYTDQFSIGADIDLQKLWGWADAAFSIAVANRNGDTLDDDINDPRASGLGSVQEIHGRGSVTRLSELWVSKGWLADTFNLKLGRMASSDDFASEDCLFQNVAFCGAQPGNYVSSIHNGPISSWGARLRYRVAPDWYVQAGAYAINSENLDNSNGFRLNPNGTNGGQFPVELLWKPTLDGLPGEYRLGYYKTTAAVADVYDDEFGKSAAISGNDYRKRDRRDGWWVVAKQQLTDVGGDRSRGLTLVASATFHDRQTTPVVGYQKVSMVYTGPFDTRPQDELGVGIARMQVSSRFLRNAKNANELSGLTYDDASYVPQQHDQYQAELHYRVHATGWMSVMPNLQYVKDPGGVKNVDDAWVLGLQVQSQF
ncbi:carbohydrate porin [Pseudomonas silvicola]|nr:carbohydrate porin [Pseudomonas silvicola]